MPPARLVAYRARVGERRLDRFDWAATVLCLLVSAAFWWGHVTFAPSPPPDWWVMPLIVVWLATLWAVAVGMQRLRRYLTA